MSYGTEDTSLELLEIVIRVVKDLGISNAAEAEIKIRAHPAVIPGSSDMLEEAM